MKKKDLKAGMIVQTRRGERYVVLDETINNMDRYFPLCYYNEDLKHHNGLSEWDVVEVFTSDSSSIPEMLDNKHQLLHIWKREEDNRKEIPSQMDYLKDLYIILHRQYGRKIPCIEFICSECPLNTNDNECLEIKIRKELEKVNKEWKLDR